MEAQGGIKGWTYGGGPVKVVIGNTYGDPTKAAVRPLASDAPGWLAFKTIWFSLPRYTGPFVVRATDMTGAAPVALQSGALVMPIVVPPGATVNDNDGWRFAPDGTYVKKAGCYGFQIDGLSFSEVVVIRVV